MTPYNADLVAHASAPGVTGKGKATGQGLRPEPTAGPAGTAIQNIRPFGSAPRTWGYTGKAGA